MAADMKRLLGKFSRRPPATNIAIAAVEEQLSKKLPNEYVDFLKLTNGGEGFIGPKAYVMLWGVEELTSMNEAYEVQKFAPAFLIFGSDGGGEAYGFDTRTLNWAIVQVPFVGMAGDSAQPMATSFTAFLQSLYEID